MQFMKTAGFILSSSWAMDWSSVGSCEGSKSRLYEGVVFRRPRNLTGTLSSKAGPLCAREARAFTMTGRPWCGTVGFRAFVRGIFSLA
jgi:hypothetical protein